MPPAAASRSVGRLREARESRMPIGPVPPSARKIQAMADSFGIEMSDADAADYSDMMAGTLRSYRRLDAMQETKPPVKYPRAGSYRPGPAEDPYNAWYVKGEIKGAADGVLAGKRVGIKDAICVAGFPMINGAKALEGYIPDIDATRGDPRARCRRDHPRQDQQRGLLVLRCEPYLGLRPGPQPAQADPFDRRVVQRQRRRDRGRRHRHGDRRRPGRLDPHSRELERHRRPQADLRPRALYRRHDDRDDHGPSRPHVRHGGEQRPACSRRSPARIPSTRASAA